MLQYSDIFFFSPAKSIYKHELKVLPQKHNTLLFTEIAIFCVCNE